MLKKFIETWVLEVIIMGKLLAQQIGQLVNIAELSVLTELSRVSIYRYLDIF